MPYKDILKLRAAKLRWYYKHKDQVRISRSRSRKEKLEFVRKLKDVPCVDCGKKYPYFVMDFDHQEGFIKGNNIATMASGRWGWEKLKEELAKCVAICANCHRIRTYSRNQSKNLLAIN